MCASISPGQQGAAGAVDDLLSVPGRGREPAAELLDDTVAQLH